MAKQFKFNILTGEDAPQKYANIATKDPLTFYLLQTGVGYLGTTKLFDTSILNSDGGVSIGKYFRTVTTHTITQEDLDNTSLIKPAETAVGSTGMLFTADSDEIDNGNEIKYFVPLNTNMTDTINEEAPGDGIVTEAAVVAFVTKMVEDKIAFEIDGQPGSSSGGGNDGSSLEVYSTEETHIGTWTDGKPLYRKVFPFTNITCAGNGDNAPIIKASDFSIEKIIYGCWNGGHAGTKHTNGDVLINLTTDNICIRNNFSTGTYDWTGEMILEYTKTTDQVEGV